MEKADENNLASYWELQTPESECIKRFNKWNDIGVRTSNFEGLFRRRPSNILHTMQDFVLSVRFLILCVYLNPDI